MCGIAGFTHRQRRAEPGRIRRVTAALEHRGPDQQGVWESDLVSLGAVRLRIIDLTGGEQPIISDDGGTVIVFNGEIYNHAELRRELEQRGHRFRSRCDTEVVLRAFLEWNRDCLGRLRGMFGLAIWSQPERRLLLARDRMGIKPLYYCRRGEDLYFGSELKAVLEHPELDRQLSLDGLNYYLSLNYVPCPYTLIEGVQKLPPGHWLEWRDGAIARGAFWQLRLRPRQDWTEESAVSALDRLLRDAVREHLVADVPLGVWASGGLDSSTILHYAAEASTRPLKTFSVSFLGHRFDESRYFREVSAFYGTEHQEFDLNTEVALSEAIERLPWYSDEPSADAGALPLWFLSKMCRRDVTVALSGEGADELFGGYVTYLADRYAGRARRIPAAWRRWVLSGLAVVPVSDDKISFEFKARRFLEGSLLPPEEAHFYWNGTWSRSQRRELLVEEAWRDVPSLLETLPPEAQANRGLNRFLWLDQTYYLADDILYKCDRMSMAHSLEVRPPFLDHRIVEFAASLPERLKVRGSVLKYLLRRLMSGKLPAVVLQRKKEGFDIPAHAWFRGALKPLLLATLSRRAVTEMGVLRWPAVENAVSAHLNRRANVGYHLWGLLTLFLWMKRWRVAAPLAPQRRQAYQAGVSTGS